MELVGDLVLARGAGEVPLLEVSIPGAGVAPRLQLGTAARGDCECQEQARSKSRHLQRGKRALVGAPACNGLARVGAPAPIMKGGKDAS